MPLTRSDPEDHTAAPLSHYTNQKWLRRDFGDKLPSDVFREHSLARYVTDKTSLNLRHEIGIDIIAWECDYPHSDCFWPDAPEQVLAELQAAGADDSDINNMTWQNSCRFFDWDPFANTPREQATVGALRVSATDVDVSIRPARNGPACTPKNSWLRRSRRSHGLSVDAVRTKQLDGGNGGTASGGEGSSPGGAGRRG